MSKTNQLLNPDSVTFGGYDGTYAECIQAVRLLNRVIIGATYAVSATPDELFGFELIGTESKNPYITIAENVRKIRTDYGDMGYDDDPEFEKRLDDFVHDLEQFAIIDWSNMFGFPKLNSQIRGRIVNRIHNSDIDNVLWELADVLEWARGVIFCDVLNWDYILDQMEATAE